MLKRKTKTLKEAAEDLARPIAVNWNPWGITYQDCHEARTLVMQYIRGDIEHADNEPYVIRDFVKILLQMVSQSQRAPEDPPDNHPDPESQPQPVKIGDTPLILNFPNGA